MISLLAVMHAAFFGSETDYRQRMYDSLAMLVLAAAVALVSGLLFQARGAGTESRIRALRLVETFPVRVFCWSIGVILVLFLLARWVEANCIFSPEMRF